MCDGGVLVFIPCIMFFLLLFFLSLLLFLFFTKFLLERHSVAFSIVMVQFGLVWFGLV